MHEQAVAPPMRRPRAALAGILGMLTAFGALSTDMYLPGLPTIARELHTDMAAAQQTLAVFFLGMALGQVLYGPISDRLGRRPPLVFGCALYALAGIGCALAPSIQSLVALRFVQALGACAGTVIGRSIIRDLFDQRESARMYSLLMLMMGAAPITAPSIGGLILVAFGWRAIFLALSGFGLACLVTVLCGLSETLPSERRTRAGLGAAFRAYSGLLKDRRYMGYTMASALAIGSMFAYIAGSPFVFIELHGVRPDRYGLLFGTNALGLILASQFNRWLLRRYSSLAILRTGLAIMGASGLLLAAITAADIGGFPWMLALLFGCVASNGLVHPNAIALAMAPHGRQAGSASALLGAFQMAIAAAVGALIGLLHNGTALPMVGVIATCATAAFLILQWVTRRDPFRASPI
jgi:DHA1 family bicyclomycin/chloramphenicol resistance-like MFS transporter